MYIEPNTNIKLLKNVPLDSTYEHTILFTDSASQANYFSGLTKHNLTMQSYQRVQRGTAKIGLSADSCYDCNYMMFQNTNYGNKWFYAFIQSVEYINNAVCEITFEIDVMQTWLFDVTLKECFVEREHVENDAVGSNTVDERLDIGEYVIGKQNDFVSKTGVALYVLESAQQTLINNVFTPLDVYVSKAVEEGQTAWGALSDVLERMLDKPERIAMISMISDDMINDVGSPQKFYKTFTVSRDYLGFSFNNETYVPKNNKLYCYPYCMFTIDNYNGGIEHFRWEEFENAQFADFAWEGCVVPKPCMECFPINYKGLKPSATQVNTAQQFTVVYDNFPMCPYTIDTFSQWASSSLSKQVVNTAVQTAASMATAGLISKRTLANLPANTPQLLALNTALNFAKDTYDIALDYKYHKVHSQSIGGIVGDAGMNWSAGRIGFRYTYYQIKPEYARMIDEFFTKYGYLVNRLKVPNINSRPHWNYVKTNSCILQSNAPADDTSKICSIYNNGITFWKNGNEIGNYTLDNSPQ